MSDYIYLKQPGILYDMMFALKLRFNGERAYAGLKGEISSYDTAEQFFKQVIEKLGDVSDKLLPLFYCDESPKGQTALMAYMRMHMCEFDYTGDGLIEEFYDLLRDVDNLKKFIYTNYVSDECPDVIDISTFAQIKDELFNADLPADVKMYMTSFLLYGEEEIEFIISELKKVQSVCEEIYQINSEKINEQIERFDADKVAALSKLHMFDIVNLNPIYHTYCVINVYIAYGETYNGDYLCYLGIESEDLIYKYDCSVDINLYELGRILYDETRLKILEMLKEKPMYCAQVAKALGLKNNSTLYHLSMMEREKLLRLEQTGKKIYYHINKKYLNSIKKYIDELKLENV